VSTENHLEEARKIYQPGLLIQGCRFLFVILPKMVIYLMLRAGALSYSIDNPVGHGPCPFS
jgi:hypothetical protein